MSLALRSGPSGPAFIGENQNDTLLWDTATGGWTVGTGSGGGDVLSVFGRIGAVVAVSGDYDSDQVDNVSGVAGASVSDALDTLSTSDGIGNGSSVPGATVSDALDELEGLALTEFASLQCGSGAEALSFAASAAPNTLLVITGADFLFAGSDGFALTAAAGVLTYTGASIVVQVKAVASMMSVDDAQPSSGFLIVSKNGEFVGEAPFDDAQIRAGFAAQRHDPNNAGGNRIFNMSSERQVTLDSGDTLQVVGGNGVAHDLLINAVSMLVNQVGRPASP